MNGSGISYEDVIAANVRNQKDKEIENLKQEIERLKNINEEHRILNGKLRVENNRLTNIINELEKWAEDYRFANIFKDKLQELKGR